MRRLLYIFVFFVFIPTLGCSQKVDKLNVKYNPKLVSIISNNYVNDIKCTNEDIKKILGFAERHGIKNPYIPTAGVATDYIMEIRENEERLTIVYPHFSITESAEEIPPINNVLKKRSIKLAVGDGEWIETEGNAPQLYLQLDGVYIIIHSARYFDEKEYKKVAESLVKINQL